MATVRIDLSAATDEHLVARAEDDAAARAELTERYQPLVHATANRLHRTRDHSHDDVVSAAQEGLQKAIRDFDLDRGVPFPAYARAKVHGETMRWFRDGRYAVHVPRPLHELAMRVHAVRRDLESAGSSDVDVDTIAQAVDAEPAEVLEALAVASAERARTAELAPRVATVGLDAPDPDLAHALRLLPERLRYVLWARHVIGLTQREIGERLGVSQAHVSRLERRAADRVRVRLDGVSSADA